MVCCDSLVADLLVLLKSTGSLFYEVGVRVSVTRTNVKATKNLLD